MKFNFIYSLLVLGLLITSCSKEQPLGEETNTSMLNEVNLDFATDLEKFEEAGEVSERGSGNFTFRTLNQALHCTGLRSALFSGQKTIYAPTDAAFAKLGLDRHNVCDALDAETLTSILLYHVADENVSFFDKGCVELLDGNIAQLKVIRFFKRFINDSRISFGFTQFGSSYKLRVYAIRDVLSVPMDNIVATASGAQDIFGTLVSAVLAADPGIAAALSNEDAILTVFAPTNQAFADLLEAFGLSTLEELVGAIGVENLSKVLLYHVVDACAFSNNLQDGLQISTLQGESVEVDLDNLQLIDKTSTPAGLIPAALDILTSNGIVHGIDKVLLPQEILDAL